MTSKTISLTADDIVDAWATTRKGAWQAKLLLVVSGLLFLVGGLALWAAIDDSEGFGSAATALAIGLGLPALQILTQRVIWPYNARRLMRQQKTLSTPMHVAWSEDQFTLEQGGNRTNLAFRDLFKWAESRNSVVLFQSYAVMHILPKREFGEEELAELRGFLQRAALPRHPRAPKA